MISQFGLHIIKIEAQSRPTKKVKISTLSREVRVSTETDQIYFSKASEFGSVNNTAEKFKKAIKEGEAVALTALNINETDNGITGLTHSRSLIKWAYSNSEGDVTQRVMEFDNKYVVALLDKVREDGFTAVEDVTAAITIEVRKQKQADKLIVKMNDAINGAKDINDIAGKLNVNSNTANNVRFTSYSIPNLGVEPNLQAIAINLEQGEISAPIKGNNGVYVIQLDNKDTAGISEDNTAEKSFLNRSLATRVNYSSMDVLNDLAGVEDNRINFY